MSTESKNYYNARPSKVSNIGDDVVGAKRMNFDTYETEEEREAKQKRKATDKELKAVKEQLKEELQQELPDRLVIKKLLLDRFAITHGFRFEADNSREIVREKKAQALKNTDSHSDNIKAFNKLVRAFNAMGKDARYLESESYAPFHIEKLQKKYSSKKVFTEQTGETFDWKNFEATEELSEHAEYLKEKTKAVQFGNSVSDNERAYILSQLSQFIKHWESDSIFKHADITGLNWSFGARGKRGSVAYYARDLRVISVNRNNIGSLVHEVAHHLDYENNLISKRISSKTVWAYRDKIKDKVSGLDLKYYCDRKEIFARALEAYCYKVKAGFKPFAQTGSAFLPDLNDELLELVSEAFRPWANNLNHGGIHQAVKA